MNKELQERLEKAGVSYYDILNYTPIKRPFTFGDSIFGSKEIAKDLGGYGSLLEEEIPHVAQYRKLGILNFLGRYLSEVFEHGSQAKTYETPGTLESFHRTDANEKTRLLNEVLGMNSVYGSGAITEKERDLTRNIKYWLEGDDEMSRFPDRKTLKRVD